LTCAQQQHRSTMSRVSTKMGDILKHTATQFNHLPRPTQHSNSSLGRWIRQWFL